MTQEEVARIIRALAIAQQLQMLTPACPVGHAKLGRALEHAVYEVISALLEPLRTHYQEVGQPAGGGEDGFQRWINQLVALGEWTSVQDDVPETGALVLVNIVGEPPVTMVAIRTELQGVGSMWVSLPAGGLYAIQRNSFWMPVPPLNHKAALRKMGL